MDGARVIRTKIPWAELLDPDHRAVYDTYRDLIALRRKHPELADPRLTHFTVNEGDGWLTLHRGQLRVLVNLGTAKADIPLDGSPHTVLLGQPELKAETAILAPDTFAIIKL